MKEYIKCFSCNAKSLNLEGETHKYMLSTPGCWIMFCEILEKEYSDFRYARAHNYTVDAYSVQHPGDRDISQAIKSVGIHLASLYMLFERGMNLLEAGKFKDKFAQFNKKKNFIHSLESPNNLGTITVFDVWDLEDAEQHFEKCKSWAQTAWESWNEHHQTIELWVEEFLQQEKNEFIRI